MERWPSLERSVHGNLCAYMRSFHSLLRYVCNETCLEWIVSLNSLTWDFFVVDAKSVIKGPCVSQTIQDDMRAVLKDLRGKITIGTVGGSDLDKQIEQLGSTGMYCCCMKILLRKSTLWPRWEKFVLVLWWIVSIICPILFVVLSDFDYVFSENGLVAYKKGQLVAVQSLRWEATALIIDRVTLVDPKSSIIYGMVI